MKANRVPAEVRIRLRIAALEQRLDEAWLPSSRRHFYPRCRHCEITNVNLSINGQHYQGCPLRGVDREIAWYRGLLVALQPASGAGCG